MSSSGRPVPAQSGSLPTGGTTGQALVKASNADGDGAWHTLIASDVGAQPVDSDLTAIAALTTTSYGRAFLALADAAAGRTALGLGTAATQATSAFDAAGAAAAAASASQPLDSDLTAIAALTTTSFGRGLLTMADAAAARVGLGLGSVAVAALITSTALSNLDTDVASAKAVKTYVDAHASASPTPFPGSTLSVATDLAGNPYGAATNGTDVLQHQSTTGHVLRRAGGKISVVISNFSGWLDAAPTDQITVRVGVVDPNSLIIVPAYFNGLRDVTVDPDTLMISDPASFPHADGDTVMITLRITVASGKRFTYNWITNSGDAKESSATTVTDKTLVGGMTSSVGEYCFAPFTVLSDFNAGDSPVIIGQGDSIMFGYDDNPAARGNGPLYHALNGGWAFLNMAQIGEQATGYIRNNAHQVGNRRLMSTAGKYIVSNYGINDLGGARTAAQLQADVLMIATWNAHARQVTYQCTLLPRGSSTDGFLTTANQTPVAYESIRLAYNAWLRDGAPIDATSKAAVAVGTSSNVLRAAVYDQTGALVTAAAGTGHPLTGVFEWADTVESSRNSGKWKIAAGPAALTGDGTHPNAAGNLLISAAVPTSLFV